MRMMFSKHGLWKFVDGSATISNDQDEMANYNEKATKASTLLCEHLVDAQLAHIQYYEYVMGAWETFCSMHEAKTIRNKLFL
jgi:regulator of sigma D